MTSSTFPVFTNSQQATTDTPPRKNHDPILQELWDIKERLNREANYDLAVLIREANEAARPFIKDGRFQPSVTS